MQPEVGGESIPPSPHGPHRGPERCASRSGSSSGSNLSRSLGPMPPFVFKCPNTGLNVQAFAADDPTDGKDNTSEALICLACTRVHLVNPKTGKVVGADED